MSELENILGALEALIFASDGPATPARIRKVFRDLTPAKIAEGVRAINAQLDAQGRPYQIAEVSGGYQFRTRPEYGEVLRLAQPERKVRLSRAALESLAVIAYKQPLTRAELEELRCVDCGAVIKSLLERDLVRIVGRRDAPGRPVLYGTSSSFLELFGLASLRDLPSLREIETMASEAGVSLDEAHGRHGADADADADAEGESAAGEDVSAGAVSVGGEEAGQADGEPGDARDSTDWSEEDPAEEVDLQA